MFLKKYYQIIKSDRRLIWSASASKIFAAKGMNPGEVKTK